MDLVILSAVFVSAICILAYLHFKEMADFRQEVSEERQILLNRIENPKYRPPLNPSEKRKTLEEEKALREEHEAFGLVGRIIE